MRVVNFVAENVKRIKVVDITPKGDVIEITGANGAGKSSLLDALWWAISGTANVQAMPVRAGAESATIKIDFGTLKVTRKIIVQEGGDFTTSLIVENEEGARFQKPQSVLDALLGTMAMDPLAFKEMEPKDQFNTLRRFVPGVDFEAIDKANKSDFDERAGINRLLREAKTQLAAVVVPADAPAERIDEAEIVAELQRAGERNAAIEQRKSKRDGASRDIEGWKRESEQLGQQAEALRRQAEECEAKAAKLLADAVALQQRLDAAGALPVAIDTAALNQRYREAQEHNKRFDMAERARTGAAQFTAKVAEHQAKSEEMTASINARTAEKLAAIAAAKIPVAGIEFGDSTIMLNGVPFEQASDAEQLRTSMAIAMAMNPKLRVLRIRQGSLLDDTSMALITDMAKANDFQIWIETVASGRPDAVVIEDGRVAGSATPTMEVQTID